MALGRVSTRKAQVGGSVCSRKGGPQPDSPRSSACVRAVDPHRSGHKYIGSLSKHAKAKALGGPLDVQHAGGPSGTPSFPDPSDFDLPNLSPGVPRRAALIAAFGFLSWFGLFPHAHVHKAIEQPIVTVPLAEAESACMEAAAVCSTIYSQMASTLRQLNAGFLDTDLFQASCSRRLSSPYFLDAISALQDAVPIIGSQLAYSPDLSGAGWLAASLGHPRLNPPVREKFEKLTLSTLQRARRVMRLATAMAERKYTPAGVQLLTQDVRFLATSLDELSLAVAQVRAAQRRTA